MQKILSFSLLRYVEAALQQADYARDENGIIIAQVSGTSGYFAQGETSEEARINLRDGIEGNVLLALQLGFSIPPIPGVEIEEQNAEVIAA